MRAQRRCTTGRTEGPHMSAIGFRNPRGREANRLKRTWRPFRLASLLAATIALAAVSTSAAPAADGCITRPNFQTAKTGHWYYLTDRASQRKCWFVGPRGTTVHPASPMKARLAARAAPKSISVRATSIRRTRAPSTYSSRRPPDRRRDVQISAPSNSIRPAAMLCSRSFCNGRKASHSRPGIAQRLMRQMARRCSGSF